MLLLSYIQNVNTCPVDRIPFNYIEVYSSIRGKLLNKVCVCVFFSDLLCL